MASPSPPSPSTSSTPSPTSPASDTTALSPASVKTPNGPADLHSLQAGVQGLSLSPGADSARGQGAASPSAPAAGATTGAGDAPLTLPPQGTDTDKVQGISAREPTAVLTEEAVHLAAASSSASTPSAPSPSPGPSAAKSPLSPSAGSSRPPSGGPTAGAPPAGRRPPAATGALKAGVRGAPGQGGPFKMPPSLAAKMAAMTSRSSSSSSPSSATPIPSLRPSGSGAAPPVAPRPGQAPPGGAPRPGGMAARRRGPGLTLAAMGVSANGDDAAGAPVRPPGGLAARRGGGMKLPGQGGGEAQSPAVGRRMADQQGQQSSEGEGGVMGTPFANFRKIVDPSGRLNFASKAILHADGVDFSSGASFKIKMDDFELFEELGKGNYGTVQKVVHRPTGVTMALKEIRLELDDSKLKTIITELDILHRATSPYIIDFYGAFFIESCVYYCMEFMDAGSLDFFAGCDIPEDVLARITRSMVEGLRFLKDELKIMHRDVKPTNVLLNQKGYVKLCDFGVSGQLDRSIAKTNIGCQSYMAPERIKGESMGAPTSYTASSDVWSLGLSIIEAAIGHYPYPPETYQNVFAQLTAIVHGDPPSLPDHYSETARDFVAQCLIKQANQRPTYKQLLEHPFLAQDIAKGPDGVDMLGWIERATEYRKTNPKINVPALA
ncbi:hypothetical protein JCM10213_009149 [Rhodosporidiobolus nylandii]